MREILAKEAQEIDLGKRGENLARWAVFDVSDWQKEYGDGVVQLIHQRNGDKIPYPCAVTVDGGKAYWAITSADVDVAGRGHCELQYWVDDVIVKSATYITRTSRSMSPASEEVPEPHTAWVDIVLNAGSVALESAASAEESAIAAEAIAEALAESERKAAESERAAKVAAIDAAASQEAASRSEKNAQIYAEQAASAIDGGVASFNGRGGHVLTRSGDYTADMVGAVPANRKVNGKALSSDITLSAADVSAVPTTRKVNNKELNGDISLTAADVSAVPTTRKVNGKALSGDISLTATDVGARSNTWLPTAADVGAVNKSGDTMTGALSIAVEGSGSTSSIVNYDARTFVRSMVDGKNYNDLIVGKNTVAFSGYANGNYFGYNIIHTGNATANGVSKIATGSYVGTGTYGSNNPTQITFGFVPKMVWVWRKPVEGNYTFGIGGLGSGYMIPCSALTDQYTHASYMCDTSANHWYNKVSGNTLSFYYSDNTDGNAAYAQLNSSGTTYCYMAIG